MAGSGGRDTAGHPVAGRYGPDAVRQAEELLNGAMVAVFDEAVAGRAGFVPEVEALTAIAERRMAEDPSIAQAMVTMWLGSVLPTAQRQWRKRAKKRRAGWH